MFCFSVSRVQAVLLVGFVSGTLLGCKPPTKPISKVDSTSRAQATSDQAAQRAVAAPDLALLDQVGAELVKDGSGLVTEVHLRGIDVNDALAAAISHLDSLIKLTVTQSSMTVEGWRKLSQLSNLQQLDVRDCSLDNEQLLACLAGMKKLRALRLSGKNGVTAVDDEGLKGLADCPDLKALALDNLWVSGEGLAHLNGNKKLVELYLAGTLVDDDAMQIVGRMSQIRKLRLAQTSLSSVGLASLVALPIEELDVSECSQVFDDAMSAIGKMRGLKRLNLWRDAITDQGVADLKGLTNLEWLNLDNTQLSDAGLVNLSDMTKLTFLHLGSTGVSDAGMPQLLSLQSLKDLKVTRTAVTNMGVQTIQDGIPGVSVQLKYIEGE